MHNKYITNHKKYLQVNDINIGALAQSEVVDMLRDFRPGDVVNLNISRVQGNDEENANATQTTSSNTLPRMTQINNTKEIDPPAATASPSSTRIPQFVKHSSRERSTEANAVVSPLPRPMSNQATIGERNRHKQLMVWSDWILLFIVVVDIRHTIE